ncbi:MAG: site-2 protease family protein [Planctomycetota bacterium]|nr:site-2 protease family protein [Planctomycetota bacterium]
MYVIDLFAASVPWYYPQNWPYIAMAIFGLGMVIFVHELGHFLVAKACGVKCEKFYVGFDVPIKLGWGKFGIQLPAAIWKKQIGETEYGVGMIPLGGYVKMLGQDDNPGRQAEMMRKAHDEKQRQSAGDAAAETSEPPVSDAPEITDVAVATGGTGGSGDTDENFVYDPRSYMAQTVPERMAIISAGVVMNVIFAFIFAVVAFSMGVPYQRCDIAYVLPNTPCWNANLRPGDEFTGIGVIQENLSFKYLQQEVIFGDKNGIPASVSSRQKDGTKTSRDLTLTPMQTKTGRKLPIIGMGPSRDLTLGKEQFAFPGSPVAAADGFRGNDKLVAINGQPVSRFVDYQRILAANPDREIAVTVERKSSDGGGDASGTEQMTINVAPRKLRRLGLVMRISPVLGVQPDSPADKIGVKKGDEIVSIDGKPPEDFLELAERLRRRGGETIRLVVTRKNGDSSDTLPFDVPSREVDWPFRLGRFMELPTLGIAFEVPAVIEGTRVGWDAEKEDIQSGDRIVQVEIVPANDAQQAKEKGSFRKLEGLRVDGEEGMKWANWLESMQLTQPDSNIKLTLWRDGKAHTVTLPQNVSGESYYADRGFIFKSTTNIMQPESFGESCSLAWRETKYSLFAVYRFLHKLFAGDISWRLLGGPGTIAAAAGITAKQGITELLIFLTLLSANLAVVNFLPIPVLDGGHMVFLMLEGIFRRPVSEKIVIPLTYLGLFLILGLMLVVIGLDVDRWIVDFF